MAFTAPALLSIVTAPAAAVKTESPPPQDPLLAPHEIAMVFAREPRRLLVLPAGLAPLALQRAHYDQDDNFQGRFDL